MKKIIISWLFWATGLALLLSIDFYFRNSDGDIKSGGINELVYYLFPVLLSILALYINYLGLIGKSRLYQFSLLIVQAGVGFALYLLILILYVCESGIDCF